LYPPFRKFAIKDGAKAMSKKRAVSRREFMRGAATVAGVSMGPRTARADVYKSILPQTIIGANEKIRTGHIGLGNMGPRDLQFVVERDDMQPIAVCDLDPKGRENGKQIVLSKWPAPTTHIYFEEIIENKDVDAVVVVTPDHWHTIPTIMALEAGKDVYCEKPMSTTIAESQAVKEVVHRTKQVYQSGTMQRSGVYFQEAIHKVQSGYIGKVGRVETFNDDFGQKAEVKGIGNPPDSDPPEWLDWDRYVGWTPKVAYNPNRHIYNFRWFTEYSGGKITDWGAHLVDIALLAMGIEKWPKSVSAMGGKYIMTDNRTTPDTLEVCWDFGDYLLSFSNRAWNPDWHPDSLGHGIVFHGTLGSMYVDRKGYTVYSFRENGGCEPISVRDGIEGDMNRGHWENFAKCVRERNLKPTSDVDTSYKTLAVCIMGKCAYLAGDRLFWDAEKERFKSKNEDAERIANEAGFREYANGWSLNAPYCTNWSKQKQL
jgi:predicted dehydrogenase